MYAGKAIHLVQSNLKTMRIDLLCGRQPAGIASRRSFSRPSLPKLSGCGSLPLKVDGVVVTTNVERIRAGTTYATRSPSRGSLTS